MFLKNKFLNLIPEIVQELKNRKITLLTVIVYGSYVRLLEKAKDIDILIIVDELPGKIQEIFEIQKCIRSRIRKYISKPIDLILMTFQDFVKNLEPGTLLSTFTLGDLIVYDAINFEKYLNKLFQKISYRKL